MLRTLCLGFDTNTASCIVSRLCRMNFHAYSYQDPSLFVHFCICNKGLGFQQYIYIYIYIFIPYIVSSFAQQHSRIGFVMGSGNDAFNLNLQTEQ